MKKIYRHIFVSFAALSFFIGSAGFVTPAPPARAADTLPDPPKIITRAEWGADESLRTWQPEYQTDSNGYSINKANYIVIHHTASSILRPDDNGSGLYTGMVQGIYRWHATNASWDDGGTSTQGFGDIGYNYIIDPNGNIYQGRAGANGVIAAHTYGHNPGSIGISLIGTYGATLNGNYISHPVTPAMEESLSKLVGWLAAVNGINLNGQILIDNQYKNTLLGHKDLTPTACPGADLYARISSIRQQAAAYEQGYNGYLYQSPGSAQVFLVRDGLRRSYNNLQDFQKMGISYTKIAVASSLDLTLFPEKSFLKYPDGSLLRSDGEAMIYYLEGGKKRALNVTADQFIGLGFNWSSVAQVNPVDSAGYEIGTEIKYGPDGKLVQDANGKVYFIEKGKKRWVVSGALFKNLGYSWAKVIKDQESEKYLNGEMMRYKDGALVKGSGETVFVVHGVDKKEITSAQLFSRLDYKWSDILTITDEELNYYNLNSPVKYPSGTLIRQQNETTVYLTDGDSKRPFPSATVFLGNGYQWSQILAVSEKEASQFTAGAYVSYPVGTLLRAKNDSRVFAIKADGPSWIKTAQEFTKAGYKWEQVRVISDEEFALLYPGLVIAASGSQNLNTSGLSGDLIRIGLKQLADGESVQVTANGPFGQFNAANAKVADFSAGQIATVKADSGSFAKFTAANANTILQVLSYNDIPTWNKEINYNKFRNSIEIKYSPVSKASWLINELPLEGYIQGIGEALDADKPEYQKAFAIITRSYALYHLQNGGKRAGEIYHLNNTSSDQVYKGYAFEEIAPNLAKAVQDTAGMVMTYSDKIARAVYSSDSGGTTVSACVKWGGDFCGVDYGYLAGGVKDPEGTIHNDAKIAASHGVGMSCIGARKLAENGYTYDQLLKYYYLGIKIEKKY